MPNKELITTIIYDERTVKAEGARQWLLFGVLPVQFQNFEDLKLTPWTLKNGDLDLLTGGPLTKVHKDYVHQQAILVSDKYSPAMLFTRGFRRHALRPPSPNYSLFVPDVGGLDLFYQDHSKLELVENNYAGGGGQGLEGFYGAIQAHEGTVKPGFLNVEKRSKTNYLVTLSLDKPIETADFAQIEPAVGF